MNFNFQEQVPADFANNSRVWVYQSSRLFLLSETLEIEEKLHAFKASWKSHGATVKGYANLFFGQFIVLMADETATGVSGCSTDSSVHLIKEIETLFNVQLFERQNLAFVIKEKVELFPLSQLSHTIENNYINAETLYFNNLVQTKKELMENWIIPVKNSWLGKRIATHQTSH
jgi:hypothetical protein